MTYQLLDVTGTPPSSGFGQLELLGGGSNATFRYADPPAPALRVWTTYKVPFNAKAWHTTEENWEQVLSVVTSFGVTWDRPGLDSIGLDNWRFTSANHVVPEPGSLFLLGTGLLGLVGWRRKLASAGRALI